MAYYLEVFKWYLILILIAAFSGVIALRDEKGKRAIFKRLLEGLLVAHVVFELCFFYLGSEKVAVALGSVGAWMGTEGMVALSKELINFISKRKNSE